MPKAVCVKCCTELYPKKNGVYVLEYAHFGPYKLFHADMWACMTCGHEVVMGIAERPIAEHFQQGFKEKVDYIRKTETLIENYGRNKEYGYGPAREERGGE